MSFAVKRFSSMLPRVCCPCPREPLSLKWQAQGIGEVKGMLEVCLRLLFTGPEN